MQFVNVFISFSCSSCDELQDNSILARDLECVRSEVMPDPEHEILSRCRGTWFEILNDDLRSDLVLIIATQGDLSSSAILRDEHILRMQDQVMDLSCSLEELQLSISNALSSRVE